MSDCTSRWQGLRRLGTRARKREDSFPVYHEGVRQPALSGRQTPAQPSITSADELVRLSETDEYLLLGPHTLLRILGVAGNT